MEPEIRRVASSAAPSTRPRRECAVFLRSFFSRRLLTARIASAQKNIRRTKRRSDAVGDSAIKVPSAKRAKLGPRALTIVDLPADPIVYMLNQFICQPAGILTDKSDGTQESWIMEFVNMFPEAVAADIRRRVVFGKPVVINFARKHAAEWTFTNVWCDVLTHHVFPVHERAETLTITYRPVASPANLLDFGDLSRILPAYNEVKSVELDNLPVAFVRLLRFPKATKAVFRFSVRSKQSCPIHTVVPAVTDLTVRDAPMSLQPLADQLVSLDYYQLQARHCFPDGITFPRLERLALGSTCLDRLDGPATFPVLKHLEISRTTQTPNYQTCFRGVIPTLESLKITNVEASHVFDSPQPIKVLATDMLTASAAELFGATTTSCLAAGSTG